MFLFGIFEYGRLLMDWSLLNNAAREGCRYALANNTSSTVSTGVQGVVTSYMAGRTTSFSNFTVTVSGTHAGVSTAVNNLGPRRPDHRDRLGHLQVHEHHPAHSFAHPRSRSRAAVMMMCEGGT